MRTVIAAALLLAVAACGETSPEPAPLDPTANVDAPVNDTASCSDTKPHAEPCP